MRRLIVAALLVVIGVAGVVRLAEATPPERPATLKVEPTAPHWGQQVTFSADPGRLRGNEVARIFVICSLNDGSEVLRVIADPTVVLLLPEAEEGGGCYARLAVWNRDVVVRQAAETSFPVTP